MKSNHSIHKAIFLLMILAMCIECRASEKSKYFGAKLVELDALMTPERSYSRYANAVRLHVSHQGRIVGSIYIRKFRTASTAVAVANQLSQNEQLLSTPSSGWFTDNDSTFEGVSKTPPSHFYVRVMKADGECYTIWGSTSEESWKTGGVSLRSLVDSFRFN